MSQYRISEETIEKLNKIYDYFGGGSKSESFENKIERLFLEAGEFRDAITLKQNSKKRNKEITDLISCCLQLLFNNAEIQTQLDETIDFTISRIENGYYQQ